MYIERIRFGSRLNSHTVSDKELKSINHPIRGQLFKL